MTVLWKCNLDPNTNGRTNAVYILKENIKKNSDIVQYKGCWHPRWNSEIYILCKDINFLDDIKIRRRGWAVPILRLEDERIR
jgi:hypothetical protein